MRWLELLALASLASLAAALPFTSKKLGEQATLTLLHEAAFLKGAVCLDGSPPGYYFRPGQGSVSSKWILHLMGGGWCAPSTDDCYNRSLTKLGSTKNWTAEMDFQGALSSDVDVNPTFYNWNMVFFIYCDGASFGGDSERAAVWYGKKIYYRGYRILTAIMEDLNRKNLTQATDVVLTGCSAGGMAVYMHMNYIQTLVPATARFSGLPDAGFFIVIQGYNTDVSISDDAYKLVKLQEMERALMSECKAAYPEQQIWKCIFPPFIYTYIKTPIMVLNSRYDTAQLTGLFHLPCLPPNCTQEEMKFFDNFAESFKQQVGVVTSDNKSSNGFFLDSCLVHCQTLDDHTWTEFKVQDRSMSHAVYDWYNGGSVEVKIDDCDYPCNPSCPGHYPPSNKSLHAQLSQRLVHSFN